MRYLVVAAMIAVLIQGLPLVVAWFRIRVARVRASARVELAAPDSLPAELTPVFDAAASQLGALGFEPSHALWSDAVMANEPRRPQRVFLHAGTATTAAVSPAIFQNGRRLFAVAFVTRFRSGHVLVTVDAMTHLSPLRVPDHEWRDSYVNDVERQWAEHEAAVRERAPSDSPVVVTPEMYVAQDMEWAAAAVEAARREGVLGPPSHGAYGFPPGAAWKLARSLVAGARRVERMERSASARTRPAAGEAWLAADLYAYAMAEAQRAAPALAPRSKVKWLIASAAASAVVLGLLFSWSFVPALLLVLLVHEAGHVAGMRRFGYRDTQILFLPFGAAAIGTKEDATPWQRLVVLLLGPVPGILVGLLCLAIGSAGGWGWLGELGLIFVVLNYINLLPVTPLDGGRIVELLFLHRTPRAGAAFLLASAVAAGLAGLALGDYVLVALSVFLILALPARWRSGVAAAQAMRRVAPGASRTDRLRAAFLALDRTGRVGPGARLPLVRAVIEHLDAPPAPAYLTVAGGTFYGLLLALPIVGTTMLLLPDPSIADMCAVVESAPPAEPAVEYGRALAEVCADPAFAEQDGRDQWKRLADLGGRSLASGDSVTGMQYFRLAHRQAVLEFGDDDPRRIATRRMIQDLVAAEDARALAARAAAEAAAEDEGGPIEN